MQQHSQHSTTFSVAASYKGKLNVCMLCNTPKEKIQRERTQRLVDKLFVVKQTFSGEKHHVLYVKVTCTSGLAVLPCVISRCECELTSITGCDYRGMGKGFLNVAGRTFFVLAIRSLPELKANLKWAVYET